MRFFRHDNHLLWLSILAVVGVTIYVLATYFTSPAVTSHAADDEKEANARRVRFAPDVDEHIDNADDVSETDDAAQESNPPQQPVSIPTHVFLDIAKQDFLKDPFVGRVVIRLYPEHAPRTTHNFAQLCAAKKYVNIPFHRVVKDFMIQGGDIVNQDGTGTFSVYGGEGTTFADEPFVLRHGKGGLLSMANSGKDTNGSQFFITTQPAPHLDGKHVVFGEVVQGMEHVRDVEREVTDPNDRPIRKCYIMNCGVVEAVAQQQPSTIMQQDPMQQQTMQQQTMQQQTMQQQPMQQQTMQQQTMQQQPMQQQTMQQQEQPMQQQQQFASSQATGNEPAPFSF